MGWNWAAVLSADAREELPLQCDVTNAARISHEADELR